MTPTILLEDWQKYREGKVKAFQCPTCGFLITMTHCEGSFMTSEMECFDTNCDDYLQYLGETSIELKDVKVIPFEEAID